MTSAGRTDPIVLSFHDSLLRQSDVDLLRPHRWLNDRLISFYFEYLEHVVYKERPSFLFIAPEVTQCLKIVAPHELAIFLEPLNLHSRRYIFFALNDHKNPNASGGMHWSLLAYCRAQHTFVHYDSMPGHNRKMAAVLAARLSKVNGIDDTANTCVEGKCGQQTNGFDCGLHVIHNVRVAAEQSARQSHLPLAVAEPTSATPIAVPIRAHLLEIIEALRQN